MKILPLPCRKQALRKLVSPSQHRHRPETSRGGSQEPLTPYSATFSPLSTTAAWVFSPVWQGLDPFLKLLNKGRCFAFCSFPARPGDLTFAFHTRWALSQSAFTLPFVPQALSLAGFTFHFTSCQTVCVNAN